MSLYDFVYNLQRKPLKTKKRILAVILAVSFMLLLAFWVISFKHQVSERSGISSDSPTETLGGDNQNLLSPAAAIFDGLKGLKSDISKKIGEFGSGTPAERPVYELPVN